VLPQRLVVMLVRQLVAAVAVRAVAVVVEVPVAVAAVVAAMRLQRRLHLGRPKVLLRLRFRLAGQSAICGPPRVPVIH
jgi:hypothetical protein